MSQRAAVGWQQAGWMHVWMDETNGCGKMQCCQWVCSHDDDDEKDMLAGERGSGERRESMVSPVDWTFANPSFAEPDIFRPDLVHSRGPFFLL